MSRPKSAGVRLLTDALLRRWPLPRFDAERGKEARGDVLTVGGSAQIPGAVVLTALSALRAGAGRVQIATAASAASGLALAFPEARVIGLAETATGELARACSRALKKELALCDALVVGPGMREEHAAADLLQHCGKVKTRCTLVVDAAALRVFRGRRNALPGYSGGIIATPHAGEMAELWDCPRDHVHAKPLELAREAAAALDLVLVLKGEQTLIVAPDGAAYRNVAGNAGLATAGSGDTLCGLIAGLAARGAEPLQAAVWGVYLHAKAGEVLARKVGPLGYLARELAAEVPRLLAKLGGSVKPAP